MKLTNVIILLLLTYFKLSAQIDSKKYFEQSKLLSENKNYRKALSEIDNAIKLDSLNKDYLFLKMKILYNMSDCSNAILVLQKIVLIEGTLDDLTISYYADLCDCIGESEKATETMTEYIKYH